MAARGGCLGVTLDREEDIYICDRGRQELIKVTQQGRTTVLAKSVSDRKFQCPNFSVFDSSRNFHFFDSGEWKRADGMVCRLLAGGKAEVFSRGPFHFANGSALDAAERYLYVVESNLDRVTRIEIRPDGSAGPPDVFAEGLARVPDGLAFDAEGNLYVTTYASNCIYRVRPDRRGNLVCQDVENLLLCQATNCAFGGVDFDQLYVANLGPNHISVLDLKIKGQPLWNHRTG